MCNKTCFYENTMLLDTAVEVFWPSFDFKHKAIGEKKTHNRAVNNHFLKGILFIKMNGYDPCSLANWIMVLTAGTLSFFASVSPPTRPPALSNLPLSHLPYTTERFGLITHHWPELMEEKVGRGNQQSSWSSRWPLARTTFSRCYSHLVKSTRTKTHHGLVGSTGYALLTTLKLWANCTAKLADPN